MSEAISPVPRLPISPTAVDYNRTKQVAGPESTSATDVRDEKLKKATQDFESLFLFNLLKKMRATVPRSDKSNFGMQTMRDITDEQLAIFLARQGGIGLGAELYASLQRTEPDSAEQKGDDGSNPPQIELGPKQDFKPLNMRNSAGRQLPLPRSTTHENKTE